MVRHETLRKVTFDTLAISRKGALLKDEVKVAGVEKLVVNVPSGREISARSV